MHAWGEASLLLNVFKGLIHVAGDFSSKRRTLYRKAYSGRSTHLLDLLIRLGQ